MGQVQGMCLTHVAQFLNLDKNAKHNEPVPIVEVDLPFGSTNTYEYWTWVKEIGMNEFSPKILQWAFQHQNHCPDWKQNSLWLPGSELHSILAHYTANKTDQDNLTRNGVMALAFLWCGGSAEDKSRAFVELVTLESQTREIHIYDHNVIGIINAII